MTTYTDLYSTMNIQDGMEADPDHANNFQRFLRAQLTDQILQSQIAAVSNSATRPDLGGDDGANMSTLWAYCISPGHAFLRQGSANNKIQVSPGTLLQKIADSDGNDSTLVPFTFIGTEEWTIASGDATNPRVDLLQMQLTYITDTPVSVDFEDAVTRALTTNVATATRRRVQATLTVKQGTPAASPTIPDPDAGFVPVGTVVVGHGWTTAGNAPIFGVDTVDTNNAVVHDQRMPIGMRKWITDPVNYKTAAAWALSDVNCAVTSSNATNLLWIRCPTNWGRVIAVDLNTAGITIPISVVRLARAQGSISAGFSAVSNDFGSNVASDTSLLARSRRRDFETLHTPSAGPTIQASAVSKIGVPLWASGYRVPQLVQTLPEYVYLKVTNANNPVSLGETIWYIAGI